MRKYFKFLKFILNNKKIQSRYYLGTTLENSEEYIQTKRKTNIEIEKRPYRYDIINFLIDSLNRETTYLEIGVRNPNDNFNKIKSSIKYSVDPGFEFKKNPVDYKLTSDEFFKGLKNGEILTPKIQFDVIFIDGLHLAKQVERDIENSLNYLKEDGFIVLHDCNPPTEFHAREKYQYINSPAFGYWNGTTWKAFFSIRQRKDIYSCCIDSDWGVGVISKTVELGEYSKVNNPYFEFKTLNNNRKDSLNLISFKEFKEKVK